MKHPSRASFAAALGLALTACSYQPSMQHPKLPALVPIDTTMDCPQIDLSIDRADTVRRLLRDDGARLETSAHRSARYTANFLLVPVSVLSLNPLSFPGSGHAVLNAADERIRGLLQLKREHACPPRATAVPELDDLALLDNLRLVQRPGGKPPGDVPSNDRDR